MRTMQKCIRKNLQQSTFLNHSLHESIPHFLVAVFGYLNKRFFSDINLPLESLLL